MDKWDIPLALIIVWLSATNEIPIRQIYASSYLFTSIFTTYYLVAVTRDSDGGKNI